MGPQELNKFLMSCLNKLNLEVVIVLLGLKWYKKPKKTSRATTGN